MPASRIPRSAAIVEMTSAGSLIGARSTNQTPSAKSSSSAAATCSARRVLPMPPGPVSVTRRTSLRRRSAMTPRVPVRGQ